MAVFPQVLRTLLIALFFPKMDWPLAFHWQILGYSFSKEVPTQRYREGERASDVVDASLPSPGPLQRMQLGQRQAPPEHRFDYVRFTLPISPLVAQLQSWVLIRQTR